MHLAHLARLARLARLVSVVSLASLGACHDEAKPTPPAASASGAPSTAPSTTAAPSASTASATAAAPSASAPAAALPTLDDKLGPVTKLDDLRRVFAADKSKAVGKKVRLKGEVSGIAENVMTFLPAASGGGLTGPSPAGTPGGLYGLHFEVPGVSGAATCYVGRDVQQGLLKDFVGSNVVTVEVEGVVEATFGDLAPCKVLKKHVAKK